MRTPKFSTLLVPVPLLFLASLASAQTGSPLAFESTGEHQGQSVLVMWQWRLSTRCKPERQASVDRMLISVLIT